MKDMIDLGFWHQLLRRNLVIVSVDEKAYLLVGNTSRKNKKIN